ncbi:glycosyl transferase group 1 [Methylobacterium sp. 4-46]|uniref:glycosyltransferase n=1 Tax=unclassified Methylobacterium TaxID=2615210 RepID=UPI000152BE42|nr:MULTISPECIES: glycosyltransferase [Methylobacterium]ACA19300.1 glycosyl transferase group 1 [Methylobacterium sp. 4-46]WFT78502.1 glycosyltransferase [Methylobacterium nodulans]
MSRSGLRLLSVNNYFYRRGGADVVFLEQNELFEAAGWEVAPFAMQHPQNLPTPWASYFVDEIELGRRYGVGRSITNAGRVMYSLQARSRLAKLLDRFRPDIAHIHNIYHHLSPSILPLMRARGIPIVMSVHDMKLVCPAYTAFRDGQVCRACQGAKLYNAVRYRCLKGSRLLSGFVALETSLHRLLGLYASNVSRFVVPSRYYRDILLEAGWPSEKVAHVPNFVDPSHYDPSPEIGDRFVYFGRLDRLKGIETLLRAAAQAGVPLTLAGRGPDEDSFRQLAESLGSDVHFAGHLDRPGLAALLRTARAAVLPSVWNENAPVSVLEAYAAGRPVIASRIAGIPELIREGETGVLVPPGNVAALADALSDFAAMPPGRVAALGAAARAWAARDFSPEAYRSRVLGLYAELGVSEGTGARGASSEAGPGQGHGLAGAGSASFAGGVAG